MLLDLRFRDLARVRIDGIQIAGVLQKLRAITAQNLAKMTLGVEPKQLKDRKEKMKRRLLERNQSVTFEEATEEVGRERILLSLYLEYAARLDAKWLPKFDEAIAISVLGTNGERWHAGRRRQAVQLFFTHFDQLPASGLSHLCRLLADVFDGVESAGNQPTAKWQLNGKLLFSPVGHLGVSGAAEKNETLPLLMERFGIPSDGRFAECLRQVFLLNALRDCPLGKEIPALVEIEALKRERASASQLIGAAALQIMVQRVIKEGRRKWSGGWPNWISRLGCDPRYGRATAEGAKWWGWATDDELRLAQQGITGLTLSFFIDYLRRSLHGTEKQPQFAVRAQFLQSLFDSGKIQSARLALNWTAYQRLHPRYRDVWTVAHLSATTDETSMICLKCVDDIFVIEGTHSFGLRMFHQNFPIPDFWECPRQTYQDRELRISREDCDAFLPHDQARKWVDRFFYHLRTRFHIEWNDVRL